MYSEVQMDTIILSLIFWRSANERLQKNK